MYAPERVSKKRVNKYLDNLDQVKTWVDMNQSDPYSDIDLNRTTADLATSYISDNNTNSSIITSYQNEIRGLYCEDPNFLYRNANNSHKYMTCHDIYWRCHKCDHCKKWRKLDIMNKIESKFDNMIGKIDVNNLYEITIRDFKKQGLTAAKISKKFKYEVGSNNQLLHTTNEEYDMITFLVEGEIIIDFWDILGLTWKRISKEDAIRMVGLGDKYRFLGKFYAQVAKANFSFLTQEELDELKALEAYKSDKCDCGQLWEDHTIRKAKPFDFANIIKAEKHYEMQHEEFINQYFKPWMEDLN